MSGCALVQQATGSWEPVLGAIAVHYALGAILFALWIDSEAS